MPCSARVAATADSAPPPAPLPQLHLLLARFSTSNLHSQPIRRYSAASLNPQTPYPAHVMWPFVATHWQPRTGCSSVMMALCVTTDWCSFSFCGAGVVPGAEHALWCRHPAAHQRSITQPAMTLHLRRLVTRHSLSQTFGRPVSFPSRGAAIRRLSVHTGLRACSLHVHRFLRTLSPSHRAQVFVSSL